MNGVGKVRRSILNMCVSVGLGVVAAISSAEVRQPTKEPSPDAKSRYVFGMVAKSSTNPVYIAARSGAEAAARRFSAEHGVQIEIVWRSPFSDDSSRQAELVRELTVSRVDGIAISASDPTVVGPAIDAAVAAGVEVVTFDSDVSDSRRFAYYGINDREAGAEVLRQLVETMPEGGRVAMLVGNRAAENLRNRVIGAAFEARQHESVELVGVFDNPETPAGANAAMQRAHERHGPIDGWALMGGWPLYDPSGLDGIPGDVTIVSMDPLPPALDFLDSGRVATLVAQPYYGWGFESVRLLFEKQHFDKTPEQAVINPAVRVVTPEDSNSYRAEWYRWDGAPVVDPSTVGSD